MEPISKYYCHHSKCLLLSPFMTSGTYMSHFKESFQARWDNSIPLFLHAAIYSSIAHSIICTRLFRGKMHSDWFNGIEILQGRWQHGEKVGYSYRSGLEKTLCKWDMYVPLVTKGLIHLYFHTTTTRRTSGRSQRTFQQSDAPTLQYKIIPQSS